MPSRNSSRLTLRALTAIALLALAVLAAPAQITESPRLPGNLIHVRVTRPAQPQTISPLLFSSFLEPIGHSTYGGLWAQLLVNPSFEEGLWSAENLVEQLNVHPGLREASALGLPAPWEPLDPAEGARYAPVRGDASNGAQSMLLMSLPGKEVGLLQQIYLPTHRELRYNGTVWLKGVDGSSPVHVSLRRHAHPAEILAEATVTPAANTWTSYPFRLAVQPGTLAALEPVDFVVSLRGESRVLVDNVSMYPEDAIEHFDPEVLALARDLQSPLIRFGGNFTSAYNWRDGIGPLDNRVPMLNVAWGIPEENTFGTDEFLAFCKLVHAQPQVALNLGTASPQDAADWVRYIDSHWNDGKGGLTWELGNELWGNYQVGYPDPAQAAARTLAASNAVRVVDPGARLIATGGDAGHFQDWNAGLLKTPPSTFDLLSSHFIYTEDVQLPSASTEFRTMAMLATPWGLADRIDAMHQQVVAAGRPDVRFAFTEWLMITFTHNMPNYSNQGGAVFAGGFLNTMLRKSGDVALADMTGVLEFGGIWKKKEQVYVSPAYWVLRSYAQARPHLLFQVASDSPMFSISHGVTQMPEVKDVPFLDVVAAESEDRSGLLLFCVNRNPNGPETAEFDFGELNLSKTAQVTTVAADGLLEENDEYQPERISAITQPEAVGPTFHHTFPAASVTVIRIARR